MGLIRQPRFARPIRTTVYRTQDALRARQLTADRTDRHTALANAEECTQIAVARRVENNSLAVLVMGDPLAGGENFVIHHQDSLGWCRPIHPGPSGSLLVQSGSMMRPTSASAPAHRMRPRSRC